MGPFPTPTLAKESSPGKYFDNDNVVIIIVVNDDDGGKKAPDQDYADGLSTQPSAIMLSLTADS